MYHEFDQLLATIDRVDAMEYFREKQLGDPVSQRIESFNFTGADGEEAIAFIRPDIEIVAIHLTTFKLSSDVVPMTCLFFE